MKNERTANEAIADYNAKDWEQRQQWQKEMKYTEKKQGKPSRDRKQARENKRYQG